MLIVQGSARAQGFKGSGVALGLGLDIERSWVAGLCAWRLERTK